MNTLNRNPKRNVKNFEIELIVKNAFKEANVDYNNPRKEDLIKVLDSLAKLSRK